MMLDQRNQVGLTSEQIRRCEEIWEILGGSRVCPLDVSEAANHSSKTRFNQGRNVVYLGADVYPGIGLAPRCTMSVLACLAHELGHASRYRRGYDRPVDMPDKFLDEAEASLDASFSSMLSAQDRRTLVEDAREQVERWLNESR